MSPHVNFIPLLVIAAVIVGPIWFSWDMRSILRSIKRKNQLSLEGRWKDLEELYKRAERPLRPFVWLHRKYLLPGNIETQYALFLHKRGRLEEALAKIEQAIRRNKNKPGIFRSYNTKGTFVTLRGALRTRILILSSLGRYDEARATSAELDKLTAPQHQPNAALALLELRCGHLDEALAEALATKADDSQYDSMRAVAALVYCHKGEFQKALEVLSYEPADAFKFYSKSGLESLTRIPEGADLIAVKRKKLAGVFPPARFLKLASVHLFMENFEQADRALDEAEKSLGPEAGLQVTYFQYRACSFAGQGKSPEAEIHIERMRALVKELPKRSLLWESFAAAGRAYLYLARYPEALSEFMEAQRIALHPMEKHSTSYWTARTYEASGNQTEANAHYQIVVADGIPSRWHEQAVANLARSNT